MGTSVTTVVEKFNGDEWVIQHDKIYPTKPYLHAVHGEYTDSPFKAQDYGLFAFIGDVRNDYVVPPIAPHRGLPEDHKSITQYGFGGYEELVSRYPYEILEGHSKTWVSAKELLDFNYDIQFENRRGDHGTVPNGQGQIITIRELLGDHYFKEIEALKQFSAPEKIRIIFAFES